MGDNEERDELAASQCSPCGRMVCIYDKHASEIQIFAARFRQVVLRRAVWPIIDAKANYFVTICWSRCSSRAMVVVRTDLGHSATDHLHILQIC